MQLAFIKAFVLNEFIYFLNSQRLILNFKSKNVQKSYLQFLNFFSVNYMIQRWFIDR